MTLNDGKTADYGFGWEVTEPNGRRLVQHGGRWQGVRYIACYPDDDLAMAIHCNWQTLHFERWLSYLAPLYSVLIARINEGV